MDERVKELLDRVRNTAVTMGQAAGVTARYAGKCAGQMVDVAKLNMKIFDLKTDINGLLREIGSLVYAAHQGKDPQGDRVEELLSQIDGKHQSIAACKEQIAVLKKCRECPGCGTMCGRDDKFCKSCGRPL